MRDRNFEVFVSSAGVHALLVILDWRDNTQHIAIITGRKMSDQSAKSTCVGLDIAILVSSL